MTANPDPDLALNARNFRLRLVGVTVFTLLLVLPTEGCRQPVANPQSASSPFQSSSISNPFGNPNGFAQSPSPGAANPANANYQAMASQMANLQQRLSSFDTDNQLLNTEVATLKQKLQLANEYGLTLKQQLADTSQRAILADQQRQAAVEQLARYSSAQPAAGSQGQLAGFQRDGGSPGATLRANNTLMDRIGEIQIAGGQARMDGDVIRIEFQTDRMFVPATYQIQPAQLPVLQSIVRTIQQSFPKQIIGIEAHWDNSTLAPANVTAHQLTATQALAVFDRLQALGLPSRQMFTMAMGSNRPRHPNNVANGVSPNRRVELVIYPETYDGT